MKVRNKIVRLRKQQPLLTGSEIIRKIGISRQYVSKILKQEGLHNTQPTYKNKVVTCKVCGRSTPKGQQLCPTGDCKDKYYNIGVTCSFCKVSFVLKRGHIVQRYNRGLKHIYCSSTCYAKGQKDGLSRKEHNEAKNKTF